MVKSRLVSDLISLLILSGTPARDNYYEDDVACCLIFRLVPVVQTRASDLTSSNGLCCL